MRLPAELRNQIYEHTLGGLRFLIEMSRDNKKCIFNKYSTGVINRYVERYALSNVLGLTAVCRQLHTETHLLPFRPNDFAGWSKSFTQAIDRSYLSPRQMNTIRKARLVLEISDVFGSSTPDPPVIKISTIRPHLLKLAIRFRSMDSLRQVVIILKSVMFEHIQKSVAYSLKNWLKSLLTKGDDGQGASVTIHTVE